MRHSLRLSIGPLMCFGCFVIAWWGCAASTSLVGNPAVDGTLTHNALDVVVFYPAWTSIGGGGPCKVTWHFTKTR